LGVASSLPDSAPDCNPDLPVNSDYPSASVLWNL
jgi:hypothetical protein